jgi:hypothetical protein
VLVRTFAPKFQRVDKISFSRVNARQVLVRFLLPRCCCLSASYLVEKIWYNQMDYGVRSLDPWFFIKTICYASSIYILIFWNNLVTAKHCSVHKAHIFVVRSSKPVQFSWCSSIALSNFSGFFILGTLTSDGERDLSTAHKFGSTQLQGRVQNFEYGYSEFSEWSNESYMCLKNSFKKIKKIYAKKLFLKLRNKNENMRFWTVDQVVHQLLINQLIYFTITSQLVSMC